MGEINKKIKMGWNIPFLEKNSNYGKHICIDLKFIKCFNIILFFLIVTQWGT